MKLSPWDPDLQTLATRIANADINLQPEFQRGEVWGLTKKRRLIDTILRNWHIPPVHVVEDPETGEHEVLDGQQRLAAIRDFVNGEITVDGSCPPEDPEISALDGLTYEQLPSLLRRRFDTYSIRVIKIQDYSPDEPGELFFRLNQPTNLTAAEQRNAFFGPVRSQVKRLVASFIELGIDEGLLGFRNSRMAYDDIVARVCFIHQEKTLRSKVTASVITTLYRSGEPFSSSVMSRVSDALDTFSKAMQSTPERVKFNKATVFTWLTFISQLRSPSLPVKIGPDRIGQFIVAFESHRQGHRDLFKSPNLPVPEGFPAISADVQRHLVAIFNDRASARVADVSSVCTRDFVLWCFATASSELVPEIIGVLPDDQRNALVSFREEWFSDSVQQVGEFESDVDEIVGPGEWGRHL